MMKHGKWLVPSFALGMFLAAGCQNTAEGVKDDAAKNTAAVEKSAEVAGEKAAQAVETAGEKTAQAAANAGKTMANAGQDVTGALQVTPMVKTAIAADTDLNDAKNKIDVDSKDGIVHLKGHVTTNELKKRAGEIAEKTIKDNKGTDKVMNQLLVQP